MAAGMFNQGIGCADFQAGSASRKPNSERLKAMPHANVKIVAVDCRRRQVNLCLANFPIPGQNKKGRKTCPSKAESN